MVEPKDSHTAGTAEENGLHTAGMAAENDLHTAGIAEESRGKRLVRVLVLIGLLAAAGAAGLWLSRLGAGIPCVFRLWTGLECPGCGITRMLLALSRGDLSEAWRFNPFVMTAAPFLLLLFIRVAVRYVASGERRLTKAENAGVWLCVIGLLLFGILRNTPLYPYGQLL